jgi:hypothetical protein
VGGGGQRYADLAGPVGGGALGAGQAVDADPAEGRAVAGGVGHGHVELGAGGVGRHDHPQGEALGAAEGDRLVRDVPSPSNRPRTSAARRAAADLLRASQDAKCGDCPWCRGQTGDGRVGIHRGAQLAAGHGDLTVRQEPGTTVRAHRVGEDAGRVGRGRPAAGAVEQRRAPGRRRRRTAVPPWRCRWRPALCCWSAVSRVAVPGEHTASAGRGRRRSRRTRAPAWPGVHSVLKKLWLAPIT